MDNGQMKSYWSQEVSKLLDISTSALRKWSIALEENGYGFTRDENGKRAYLERDIVVLLKMRELLEEKMGMENAAKAIISRLSEQFGESRTVAVREHDNRSSERYLELKTQLQKIQEENEKLHGCLERIEQRLEAQQDSVTIAKESVEEKLDVLLSRVDTYGRRNRWWNFWR